MRVFTSNMPDTGKPKVLWALDMTEFLRNISDSDVMMGPKVSLIGGTGEVYPPSEGVWIMDASDDKIFGMFEDGTYFIADEETLNNYLRMVGQPLNEVAV